MHRRPDGNLIVSATDLVGFLECGHLTQLERAAAANLIPKPVQREDPEVELLQRRGGEHEQRYIDQLRRDNRVITDLSVEGDGWVEYEERAARTIEAMQHGDDVIFQATVFDGRWVGHPDFLLRVPGKSALGDWHYEVADTKLARSAKASALIQICSYVDQIVRIQGVTPENVYVVTGGAEIGIHDFRTAEMMAYYRHAKRRFEQAIDDEIVGARTWPIHREESYPDPVEHCAVCKWFPHNCRVQWRDDDALPLVAGISRTQRKMLTTNSVETMTALSTLPEPIQFEGMKHGQSNSMWTVREQARLQVKSASTGKIEYELLDPDEDSAGQFVPNRGLSALPPKSDFDLFFDIEGDPFAFWEGLEYLFGVWDGADYQGLWAMDRDAEKQQFQNLMDRFHDHWKQHPEMHVYHYGVYEPSRLKQLAGRHATHQEQLDDLLTAGVFVDLFRVVRQGVRVGSERYSIKNLEPLYDFKREIELRDANSSIVEFEKILEIGDPGDVLKASIADYNKDDCVSTELLRDWLEDRRLEAAQQFGRELPRPRKELEEAKPPTEWGLRLADLLERLTANLPTDPIEVDNDPNARASWLLANLLDWHRREDKAAWWRFFELITLSDDELFQEQEPISHLRWEAVIGETRTGKKIHRYKFPVQEHKVGNRSDLYDPRLPPFEEGELGNGIIDKDNLTLDLTRPAEWDGRSLTSVVPHDRIPIDGLQEALARFGEWVIEHGIGSESEEFRAARDLIHARWPRVAGHVDGQPLYESIGGGGSTAAQTLARRLDSTTLAIQGPPGSGKTYSGARMILELIRDGRGRRVGVTGSSHKVVANLLEEVWDAAGADKPTILQKVDAEDKETRPWRTEKDNKKIDRFLSSEEEPVQIVAGTVWLFARDEMYGSVDTLFVDEAGQVALANVVAAGGSARNIVLLGDPQQLNQVLNGSHPPGAEKSSLGHFLGKAETVPPERGVFLGETWRMHPRITTFTSDQFYEDKLKSVEGLERQVVSGDDWLSGSGLRWVEVPHDGNTNSSIQEATRVVEIVHELIGRDWTNKHGLSAPLGVDDIRIVSPFNAHRLLIDDLLAKAGIGGVPVGTVDKFQGQEAAVSIYTMATSRPEDAPRGVDFLYALDRLNVATSRARALTIVVCSPALLGVVPKTPDQLRMANGLAAFVEMAEAATGEADPSPTPERATAGEAPIQLDMSLG